MCSLLTAAHGEAAARNNIAIFCIAFACKIAHDMIDMCSTSAGIRLSCLHIAAAADTCCVTPAAITHHKPLVRDYLTTFCWLTAGAHAMCPRLGQPHTVIDMLSHACKQCPTYASLQRSHGYKFLDWQGHRIAGQAHMPTGATACLRPFTKPSLPSCVRAHTCACMLTVSACRSVVRTAEGSYT